MRARRPAMKVAMLSRIAVTGLLAGAGLALLVQTAAAQAPVETAIEGWVASIDASPDWNATYTSLTYDAASDRAVLKGLAIHSQVPGAGIDFGTVALTGFALSADGGFTASRITADKGTLELGPFKLAVKDGEVNGLAVPALPAPAWDPQHPFTSLIRAYAPLAHLTMTNGRIAALGLTMTNAGVSSRIVYDQFRIDRWADGRIAAVTAGPLTMTTPHPDPLMQMKVARYEAHDIDVDAAVKVFDPARYAGGTGDGVWHKVTALSAYHDFEVGGPGAKLTMKLVSTENFRLRQPPRSFASYLDRIIADPNAPANDPQSARGLADMLSAYGLGRLGISGLDVAAVGIGGLHIGGFDMTDLSSERIGEIAVDDFATAVPLLGSIKLKHFVVGNVALPRADALAQAMQANAAGGSGGNGNAAPAAGLALHPGFLEMAGLDVTVFGAPYAAVDTLRVDLADYVGAVPTSITGKAGNLVVPAGALGPSAAGVFSRLGYDTLDVDAHFKAHWNAADETFNVDRLQCTVKNAGVADLSMRLGGLPRAALASSQTLSAVLPGLSLETAKLTLKDDSFVGKGLDFLAEKMHANPKTFRKRFASAMPLILSLYVLRDPKVATLVRKSGILAKLAPVVKEFVAAPGSSVTVSLAPPTPVAWPAITAAADKDPAALIPMLGLTASSAAAPSKNGGTLRPTAPGQ